MGEILLRQIYGFLIVDVYKSTFLPLRVEWTTNESRKNSMLLLEDVCVVSQNCLSLFYSERYIYFRSLFMDREKRGC